MAGIWKVKLRFKSEKHCAAFKDQNIWPVYPTGFDIRNSKLVTKKAHIQKLAIAQRVVERSKLGISLINRKRRDWILEKKILNAVERNASLMWSWVGHMARADGKRTYCNDDHVLAEEIEERSQIYRQIQTVGRLMWIREVQYRSKHMERSFCSIVD